MNTYAQFWREARHAHGLTQVEMALRLGVFPTIVSAVERGRRRYSFAQTLALIEILDLNPELIVALLLENEEKALNKAFRLNKKSCGSE